MGKDNRFKKIKNSRCVNYREVFAKTVRRINLHQRLSIIKKGG